MSEPRFFYIKKSLLLLYGDGWTWLLLKSPVEYRVSIQNRNHQYDKKNWEWLEIRKSILFVSRGYIHCHCKYCNWISIHATRASLPPHLSCFMNLVNELLLVWYIGSHRKKLWNQTLENFWENANLNFPRFDLTPFFCDFLCIRPIIIHWQSSWYRTGVVGGMHMWRAL